MDTQTTTATYAPDCEATTSCVTYYNPYGYFWQPYTIAAPTRCTESIHVFPCARCRQCQCGAASLTEPKKGKK